MMHGLKAATLALIALLAMCAMTASAASANGKLTATEYPATLDGTDIAGQLNAFTAFGGAVECQDSSYGGEAVGGGEIAAATETFTLVPGYNNAKCKSEGLKATVKTNGCDYVFHVGTETGAGKHALTTDVVCPAGKSIEITIYLSPTNENILGCKIKIGAQTGLTGASVTNSGEAIKLGGPITGLKAEEEGLCGEESTSKAEYDLSAEMTGTNKKSEKIGVSVTSAVPSNQGEMTLSSNTNGTATEIAGKSNALTGFGDSWECPGTTYDVRKYNVTPHEPIPNAVTVVTVVPKYNNTSCKTSAGLKVTVNVNKCDFVLRIGETKSANVNYAATTDVVCENAGEAIDAEVFSSSTNENIKVCTLKIPPQTSLSGPVLTNGTSGGKKDITLEGALKSFHLEESGLCGSKTTTEAEIHLALTITGKNLAAESTDMSISD